MKKKRRRQQIIFSVTVIAIIAMVLLINQSSKKSLEELRASILSEEYNLARENKTNPSYDEYYSGHNEVRKENDLNTIEILAADYVDYSWEEIKLLDNGGILTKEEGNITYQLNVSKAGAYYIEVGYYPESSGTSTIQRSLYIDGELPFEEAKNMVFERMWIDDNKDYLMVTDKNQAVPSQHQKPEWTNKKLESAEKTVTGSFVFFLEEGDTALTFESNGGELGISYIKLIPAAKLISYEEYVSYYKSEGVSMISASEIDGNAVIVQAEDTYNKTSSTLIPLNNRTSSKTMPYHASNIVFNTIGGSAWSDVGQGISWEITVQKSGLYKIAVCFMQTQNRDFYSIREIKINGEVPFEEAANVHFNYSSGFQMDYLRDREEAYYFYLEKGTNIISMTVSMGDLSYAYEQTGIAVQNFNTLYRRITAVMGNSPDSYRDYDILSNIPNMVNVLKTEYYRLTLVMESLGDSLGDNTKTTELAKLLYQMEGLIQKPDNISTELSYFNSNLMALSDWMLGLGDQPLELDYLIITGEGYELPKAKSNMIQNMTHNIKSFIGSFTNSYEINKADYDNKKDKKTVTIWIATATRDQYDITQRMVNQAFADADYNVEIKMINADSVLPATLTGNGPDIALQLNYSMPTNFAYRNAAYDLSRFDDFEEVASWFSEGAMVYFESEGGYYGLPDSMSFPIIYYRTDIFEELGLLVPNTWAELEALLPYLEAENMSAYFLTTRYTTLGGTTTSSTKPINSLFLSMIYQNGEELYNENGTATNLNSKISLLTFKKWTEYYTKHGFETDISVVTRFRTGEVPLIIEDYTYMNVIKAAAPEIEGYWGIAPIPGTDGENGYNRSTSCTVSAAMMIKDSVLSNDTVYESWEVLKWWVSEETQLQYIKELESLLGSGSSFPAANINALKTYAKDNKTLDTIQEITKWLRGTSQKPGGYIMGRTIENAWTLVVTDKADPVDTLFNKIDSINSEITIKRKEFGLD